MKITHIDYLDEFSAWITDLKRIDGGWLVKLHPNRIIEAKKMRFVVDELKKHVLNEVIELCCEALSIKTDYILRKGRMQKKADERCAIAIVLHHIFNNNIGLVHIGRQLGWRDHAMVYHALKNADVKPISHLVAKIYSRYPFLKDGFKSLR